MTVVYVDDRLMVTFILLLLCLAWLQLQYLSQPVEDLQRLWQEVKPGFSWDLSVDTLRQVGG